MLNSINSVGMSNVNFGGKYGAVQKPKVYRMSRYIADKTQEAQLNMVSRFRRFWSKLTGKKDVIKKDAITNADVAQIDYMLSTMEGYAIRKKNEDLLHAINTAREMIIKELNK